MVEKVETEQREKSAPWRSIVVGLIYGIFVAALIAGFVVWNNFL